MKATARDEGIRQLAPFAGTGEDAQTQYENIINSLYDSMGNPYQGVTSLVQRYGRDRATPGSIKTVIKEDPDLVMPELYTIIRNKRGDQLLINEQQFAQTIKTALGITPQEAETPEDNGDDTMEDDSSGDEDGDGGSQSASQSSGNRDKLLMGLIVLVGIASLYYLSRN